MQKIRPCLWFDGNAEQAVHFYLSVFKGKITQTRLWGEAGPGPKGSVLGVDFELEGQAFQALNGGPHYKFTPALSLFVDCADQAEVDTYWNKLAEGGEMMACGWVTDKFGVTWQIVPHGLDELLFSQNSQQAERAMETMMTMKKLDIETIKAACGFN